MAKWNWGEKIQCTCTVCNKEFLIAPSSLRAKSYCSPECRKELRTTICNICGKEIKRHQAKRYMGKDFCSEECKREALDNCKCDYCGKDFYTHWKNKKNYCCQECKEQGKKTEVEAQKIYTCNYCGKRFARKACRIKGKKKIYCSPECQVKDRKREAIFAVCLYCGKRFEGRSWQPNKFCSYQCSGKYYGGRVSEETLRKRKIRKHEKEKAAEVERQKKEMIAELKQGIAELKARQKELKKIKVCKCCGKVFKSNRPVYCSDACARRVDNLKHDKRIYKNGKPDLSINLFSLYKRDSGICKLCGKLTNFTADIQADEYPSIDHIKPLSKGGKHEWSNVQLAHRGCNTTKSDTYTPGA